MKVETLGYLVDTKDLYLALAEFKTLQILPEESKRFLAFQIRRACREMKKAAIYVEEQMNAMDPPKPRKKRVKSSSGKRPADASR